MVLVNAQRERLFGYPRDELIGRPVEMLVPDHIRQMHPDLRTHYFNDPKPRPMAPGKQLVALRKDGTEIPVEISLIRPGDRGRHHRGGGHP